MKRSYSIISALILICFFYVVIELFRYFSYWGLGISILLLALLIIVCIASILFYLIFRFKTQILNAVIIIVNKLKTTKKWQQSGKYLNNKYPKLYQFILNRIDKKKFFGLYFSFGSLISIIFLLSFIGSIFDVLFKDPIIMANTRIIYLFRTIVSQNFDQVFIFFTNLGNWQTVAVIFVGLALILIIYKKYQEAKYLSLILGLCVLLLPLTKLAIQRSRPAMASLIELPSTFSFPSGHSLLAVCLYGFIAYLLVKNLKKNTLKVVTAIFFLVFILSIGLSRIYLGVHYPSDVLAGWYLGLSILSIVITFFEVENLFYPKKINTDRSKLFKKITASTAIFYLIGLFIILSYLRIEIIKPQNIYAETDVNNFISTASLYSENLYGQRIEPISFIVIGDEENLKNLFISANWQIADLPNFINTFKLSSAIAKNISYPTAPMTPSFYNGKNNNLGFEKATATNSARQRHHTRYWQTNYTVNGQNIWVATASFDQGIEIGSIIKLPTHRINPDIDKEREFIIGDLNKTGLIKKYQLINLMEKMQGKNSAGDNFFTDGKAYIIYL